VSSRPKTNVVIICYYHCKLNTYNDNLNIVSVKDTGQGTGLSILPRLFTKFASKFYQGNGLGLFIAKGIVEAHGGNIWAENNPGSNGTTFLSKSHYRLDRST
jgi:signal transduction histidine kinase